MKTKNNTLSEQFQNQISKSQRGKIDTPNTQKNKRHCPCLVQALQ